VPLGKGYAAVGIAAIAILALVWLRNDPPAPAPARRTTPGAAGATSGKLASQATTPAPALAVPSSVAEAPPFRAQDFAVTTDAPDGPGIALRSSTRVGRNLAVELATTGPLRDGARVFATVSVSDGLGNTLMDCTWRDIELTGDDPRTLDCELPVDTQLPLAISAHQRSGPSFVESPTVVAVDTRVTR
jgi:hypothetical protein